MPPYLAVLPYLLLLDLLSLHVWMGVFRITRPLVRWLHEPVLLRLHLYSSAVRGTMTCFIVSLIKEST